MTRHCPLCNAALRRRNPGPFCMSRECVRAHLALQAFVNSELGGRSVTRMQIDKVLRDDETVYTVRGRYTTRKGKTVILDGVRFNEDGIAMGQRVVLSKGGPR